jgi:hypothetical protein
MLRRSLRDSTVIRHREMLIEGELTVYNTVTSPLSASTRN